MELTSLKGYWCVFWSNLFTIRLRRKCSNGQKWFIIHSHDEHWFRLFVSNFECISNYLTKKKTLQNNDFIQNLRYFAVKCQYFIESTKIICIQHFRITFQNKLPK